jgi:hypothetical protein
LRGCRQTATLDRQSTGKTMPHRRVLLYFAWSRLGEAGAPMLEIDDRFPAVFELRRLFYPRYETLADPAQTDQGIAGFLDHIQKPNFTAFTELAEAKTGQPVRIVERGGDDGGAIPLDEALIGDADTIVVISFDSLRTVQAASAAEIDAVGRFLSDPDHLIFVCPHHDIGETSDASPEARLALQTAEHRHHGDIASPPRQGFGGFARTLLAGLDAPVENRFGLRPSVEADGAPTPLAVDRALDDLGLLNGVATFNLHPHLPQLERLGAAIDRMQVLARQKIDLAAPPHPFTKNGRDSFDALLQSAPGAFAGRLLVCDTTEFTSTNGGEESLRRFWTNIVERPVRS